MNDFDLFIDLRSTFGDSNLYNLDIHFDDNNENTFKKYCEIITREYKKEIPVKLLKKFLIYKQFNTTMRNLGYTCFLPNSMEDVDFVVELMSGIYNPYFDKFIEGTLSKKLKRSLEKNLAS
jgi:hypothetical protein